MANKPTQKDKQLKEIQKLNKNVEKLSKDTAKSNKEITKSLVDTALTMQESLVEQKKQADKLAKTQKEQEQAIQWKKDEERSIKQAEERNELLKKSFGHIAKTMVSENIKAEKFAKGQSEEFKDINKYLKAEYEDSKEWKELRKILKANSLSPTDQENLIETYVDKVATGLGNTWREEFRNGTRHQIKSHVETAAKERKFFQKFNLKHQAENHKFFKTKFGKIVGGAVAGTFESTKGHLSEIIGDEAMGIFGDLKSGFDKTKEWLTGGSKEEKHQKKQVTWWTKSTDHLKSMGKSLSTLVKLDIADNKLEKREFMNNLRQRDKGKNKKGLLEAGGLLSTLFGSDGLSVTDILAGGLGLNAVKDMLGIGKDKDGISKGKAKSKMKGLGKGMKGLGKGSGGLARMLGVTFLMDSFSKSIGVLGRALKVAGPAAAVLTSAIGGWQIGTMINDAITKKLVEAGIGDDTGFGGVLYEKTRDFIYGSKEEIAAKQNKKDTTRARRRTKQATRKKEMPALRKMVKEGIVKITIEDEDTNVYKIIDHERFSKLPENDIKAYLAYGAPSKKDKKFAKDIISLRKKEEQRTTKASGLIEQALGLSAKSAVSDKPQSPANDVFKGSDITNISPIKTKSPTFEKPLVTLKPSGRKMMVTPPSKVMLSDNQVLSKDASVTKEQMAEINRTMDMYGDRSTKGIEKEVAELDKIFKNQMKKKLIEAQIEKNKAVIEQNKIAAENNKKLYNKRLMGLVDEGLSKEEAVIVESWDNEAIDSAIGYLRYNPSLGKQERLDWLKRKEQNTSFYDEPVQKRDDTNITKVGSKMGLSKSVPTVRKRSIGRMGRPVRAGGGSLMALQKGVVDKEASLQQKTMAGSDNIMAVLREQTSMLGKNIDGQTKEFGETMANNMMNINNSNEDGGLNVMQEPPADIEALGLLFFNKTWGVI